MLDNITTLEELEKEALRIDQFLQITVTDDPSAIMDRGNELSVELARTGKMKADAKYWLTLAENKSIVHYAGIFQSAMVIKEAARTDNAYEIYLFNFIDRLNATCTHQLDWVRSLLSYSKEEMRQTPPASNTYNRR